MAPKKPAKAEEAAALNNFSFFTEMKTGNKFADAKKTTEPVHIDTGCYAFNAIYSGDMTKGFLSDRITMLAGEEAVGKTFFTIYGHALPLVKQGYFIFYIDTENSISEQMLISFGLPKGSFRIIRESTVEEARERIAVLLDQIEEQMGNSTENKHKCAFILDSLGQLTTLKSMSDASDGKYTRDFTKQSELKRMFAVLTTRMGFLDIPFIITNHVYQGMGSFIPTKEVAGGSGALYAASTILMLRKSQAKEDGKDENRTGSIITAKIRKSRWCREGLEVKFYLAFATGLNKWYGVHLLAQEAGLLEEWEDKHKKMGVPEAVWNKPGKKAKGKIWVCKNPSIDPSKWTAVYETDLHKSTGIGSIFEPVNEWVKTNFTLSKVDQNNQEQDEDAGIDNEEETAE